MRPSHGSQSGAKIYRESYDMNTPVRLYTLDAMRGVAAIIVVCIHIAPHVAPSGYMAVDFFFLLSGFVIGKAYQSRLAAGMSFAKFAGLRVIRMYPLYAFGLALGVFTVVLGLSPSMTGLQLVISVGFNLFMLPSPWTPDATFPLNFSAWSLFFELLVNLFFAAVMVKLSLRRLVVLAILSGCWLAWLAVQKGSVDLGPNWPTFLAGLVRTVFTFTLGVVMARLHDAPVRESWFAPLLVFALGGLLLMPAPRSLRVAYDLFTVCIAAPAVLWLGATYRPPEALRRACEALGDMSYALYAIHIPCLALFWHMLWRFNLPPFASKAVLLVSLVALAWALHRYLDVPVRGVLSRSVFGDRQRTVAQA